MFLVITNFVSRNYYFFRFYEKFSRYYKKCFSLLKETISRYYEKIYFPLPLEMSYIGFRIHLALAERISINISHLKPLNWIWLNIGYQVCVFGLLEIHVKKAASASTLAETFSSETAKWYSTKPDWKQ